ncbi:HEAT repeat domain-containing protein [Nocardia concava]|uniref:HEAT repeat domain-containing protein n=1 Tax=Nocardia concava TaxID=257281 RepID=UPI0003040C1C|nr:HEAT repeat domain-containing protein [Nocardia concava]
MTGLNPAREDARPTAARVLGGLFREKLRQSDVRNQAELAKASFCSKSSVSALLNAERPVSWELVEKMAKALDKSDEWIEDVALHWKNADRSWETEPSGCNADPLSKGVEEPVAADLRDEIQQWCLGEASRHRRAVALLPYLVGHPDPTGFDLDAVTRLRVRKSTPYAVSEYLIPADREPDSREGVGYRELVAAHRRILLVGDPGMGKSWLLRMNAIRLASEAAARVADPSVALEELVLPVHVRCDALAAEYRRLGEHATETNLWKVATVALRRYGSARSSQFWAWLEEHCRAGEVVYLFDALDETPDIDRGNVERPLNEHDAAHDRIVVACRLSGFTLGVFGFHERKEAEVLPFGHTGAYLDSWQLPEDRRRLLEERLKHTAIAKMARIPLLLAFLCHLAADPDEPLPETRTLLYGRILRRFLRGEHRLGETAEGSRLPRDPVAREHELLGLLRPLAFRIAASADGWLDRVPESVLQRHLAELDRPAGLSPAETLRVLAVETGILVPDGDLRDGRQPPYLFIHRTLMEYLVAEHISADPELMKTSARTHLHLAADWHEVWILAVGLAPAQTLDVLANQRPDLLHIGLATSAAAIAELSPLQKSAIEPHITRTLEIAARLLKSRATHPRVRGLSIDILGLLGEFAIAELLDVISSDEPLAFDVTVGAAAQTELIQIGAPAVPALLRAVRQDPARRGPALDVLGRISDPLAVPALLEAADDPDQDIRREVVRALGLIGDPVALPILLRAITDSAIGIREAVVNAFHRFGEEAVLPLMDALKRPDVDRCALVRALGDTRSPLALIKLTALLDSSDRAVRRQAVWSLGRLETPFAAAVLGDCLSWCPADVRRIAVKVLAEAGRRESEPVLRDSLTDPSVYVRYNAAWGLGNIAEKASVPALRAALSDADPRVQRKAVQALGKIKATVVADDLMAKLTAADEGVRWSAADALGEVGFAAAAPAIIATLSDESLHVRARGVRALGRIGGSEVVGLLTPLLTANHPSATRLGAIEALARIGTPMAIAALQTVSSDEDPTIRNELVQALGAQRDPALIPELVTALADLDTRVRFSAAMFLGQIADRTCLPALMTIAAGPDKALADSAVGILGQIGDPSAVPVLADALVSEYRESTVHSLSKMGDDAVARALSRLIGMRTSRSHSAAVDLAYAHFDARTVEPGNRDSLRAVLRRITRLSDGRSDERTR